MSKKYVPLTEGWVGKNPLDLSKGLKIDMSKIKPIDRIIIPAPVIKNNTDNNQKLNNNKD